MIPPRLLVVLSRLQFSVTVRSASGTAAHREASFDERVERLLDAQVLQEEPTGVATRTASVGVTALVEGVAEYLSTQTHPTRDHKSRQLAELYVGLTVASESERSSIAETYVAGFSLIWRRGAWLRGGL